MKLATEPSRIESLTAYVRARVLPANTLDGELTRPSEVLAVLVEPGAEAGRAEVETPQNRVIFATLQNFCEPALVQN